MPWYHNKHSGNTFRYESLTKHRLDHWVKLDPNLNFSQIHHWYLIYSGSRSLIQGDNGQNIYCLSNLKPDSCVWRKNDFKCVVVAGADHENCRNFDGLSGSLQDETCTLTFDRWVVWEFCPQEDSCEIPVPKWSDQGSWKSR